MIGDTTEHLIACSKAKRSRLITHLGISTVGTVFDDRVSISRVAKSRVSASFSAVNSFQARPRLLKNRVVGELHLKNAAIALGSSIFEL